MSAENISSNRNTKRQQCEIVLLYFAKLLTDFNKIDRQFETRFRASDDFRKTAGVDHLYWIMRSVDCVFRSSHGVDRFPVHNCTPPVEMNLSHFECAMSVFKGNVQIFVRFEHNCWRKSMRQSEKTIKYYLKEPTLRITQNSEGLVKIRRWSDVKNVQSQASCMCYETDQFVTTKVT